MGMGEKRRQLGVFADKAFLALKSATYPVCTVFSQMIVGTPLALPSADIHEVFWNLETGHRLRDLPISHPAWKHSAGQSSVYPPCTSDWRFGHFWRIGRNVK